MNKFYIIALMAVSTYILGCKGKDATSTAAIPAASGSNAAAKIAWINIDSLNSQYLLIKDRKDSLEQQQAKEEKAFSSKLEAFQKRYMAMERELYEVQQKAATIPPVELQALETKFKARAQSLTNEEEALKNQRDKALEALNKKFDELQTDLLKRINVYIDKLAKEKGYDYILVKGGGGGVLYGNTSLDITKPVIKALNTEYKAKK